MKKINLTICLLSILINTSVFADTIFKYASHQLSDDMLPSNSETAALACQNGFGSGTFCIEFDGDSSSGGTFNNFYNDTSYYEGFNSGSKITTLQFLTGLHIEKTDGISIPLTENEKAITIQQAIREGYIGFGAAVDDISYQSAGGQQVSVQLNQCSVSYLFSEIPVAQQANSTCAAEVIVRYLAPPVGSSIAQGQCYAQRIACVPNK